MKIRNGFVSNSSSSSFVVLLPDNFLEGIDYVKISNGEDEFPMDEFKRLVTTFVTNGGMWDEEIYDYDTGDWEFYDILYDLVQPYVIASMDTSSDGGQWMIADRNKVMNILKNVTNEN